MTNKDDFCSKTPFNLKFKSHFLQNVGESFFHFLNSYVVYCFPFRIAIDTALFPEIVHTITPIFSPLLKSLRSGIFFLAFLFSTK